ncbi:uncharacterized protein V1518DRAFT_412191 [Limtongia smithiae]|uniref:uncharacterized protein n=1 Tax=Limtongia smithiae TaxID=1125753 RepID=UPI0034CF3252
MSAVRFIPRRCVETTTIFARLVLRRYCSNHAAPGTAAKNAVPTIEFKDHRRIGAEQDLFMINELTPGSVFFLPHGTRIYSRLLEFIRAQMRVFGFEEVVSPIIYKRALWQTSGHWEKYKDDMFEVKGRVQPSPGAKADDEYEHQYGLKPMNCPGHCLMYGHSDKSYRDLPVRYADFSPLHRNESSTTISGLTRVRRFHQDDGHIFCRPDQVGAEIRASLQLVDNVYKVFGIPSYRLMLSTRPDQYIGELEEWDRAESALKDALDASGQKWELNAGDGAFYGPKIDILLCDKNNKEHQAATIQLDFQLPQRFNLTYKGDDDTMNHRPVMIHRAVFGSLERFMAILIEQNQGKWPLWLSPRQVMIVPVAERHAKYASKAQELLSGIPQSQQSEVLPLGSQTLYVDVDARSTTMSSRLREAITKGYTYLGVVGDKEAEEGTIALRKASGKPTTMLLADARASLLDEVAHYS